MDSSDSLLAFRRREGRLPFIYGHRGARATHPENTLLAFEAALDQGADGVELDVRMSADGALFVAHDDEIRVIADPKGRNTVHLSQLTSAQVRALRTRSGESVPSLKEALLFQARTGCLMNVELKSDVPHPRWMAVRAAAQIRSHGGSRILVSSFHPLQIWQVQRTLPSVPVALLVAHDQRWMKRAWPLGALGAQAAHPEARLVEPSLLARLRRRVSVINTWTVNDTEQAIELSSWGVDGLMTDRPDEIRAALVARR